MSDKTLYTIIVHSENIAGLLNQVTAVFTRRQINIESLNVSASSIKGVHKYTITAWTDKDTIEKVVKQIEKKIDVIQAHYFTEDEIYFHEIALYKVSTPAFSGNSGSIQVDPQIQCPCSGSQSGIFYCREKWHERRYNLTLR